MWSENEEEWTDKEESEDLPKMPSLEGDSKVKEGKGLTPNKLLIRPTILLAQIKAETIHIN